MPAMADSRPLPPSHWVARPEAVHPTARPTAVRAVAGVLFATPEGPPSDEALAWLDAQVQRHRRDVGGRGMFVFAFALFSLTWLAPLWSFRLPTLGRLSLERRAHVLERWERSPFGMTLFAVKAILCILWFEHPDAAEHMGFDGRPLIEAPVRSKGTPAEVAEVTRG